MPLSIEKAKAYIRALVRTLVEEATMSKSQSIRAQSGHGPNGIEVVSVGKSLKGRSILSDVNLLVPRGSVAVVEGGNGAGKTTLVRMLATAVRPDTGTARVNGYDILTESHNVRRSIGVSFANERSLYWRVTGYQNLELFGQMAGLPKKQVISRSAAICDELRIGEVATGRVARMSTGQRQRLMVARALLADPPVLLLDEPFRGLDEEGLNALLAIVRDRARKGMTVLIVAPLVEAVIPLANSTYRISDRTLHPIGPEEIIRDLESQA